MKKLLASSSFVVLLILSPLVYGQDATPQGKKFYAFHTYGEGSMQATSIVAGLPVTGQVGEYYLEITMDENGKKIVDSATNEIAKYFKQEEKDCLNAQLAEVDIALKQKEALKSIEAIQKSKPFKEIVIQLEHFSFETNPKEDWPAYSEEQETIDSEDTLPLKLFPVLTSHGKCLVVQAPGISDQLQIKAADLTAIEHAQLNPENLIRSKFSEPSLGIRAVASDQFKSGTLNLPVGSLNTEIPTASQQAL